MHYIKSSSNKGVFQQTISGKSYLSKAQLLGRHFATKDGKLPSNLALCVENTLIAHFEV